MNDNENKSYRLQISSASSRETSLDLSTMSYILTRSLPKVTFEYLRKKLITNNNENKNENLPRDCEGVDTEEERERQEDNEDEEQVPSITFDALTNNETEDQSSATGVRGLNLGWLDQEIDNDAVKANAIFVPEDCRACKRFDFNDSARPADTKRGIPSRYLIRNVERSLIEQCKVDASDTRPIWAVKLKPYPDGHIKEAKARFCVREYEIEWFDQSDAPAQIIEQRERQESNRDEERVSPVAFDALDNVIDEAQSSATMCEY
jgi:hypothetical protein